MIGTAKLLANSTETPQELRRHVTSPGGTTQAAIEYMESHGFGEIVVKAIKAAETRGKELGSQ
jgi:pyrroline-5-carboxylate reductase